MSVAFSGFYTLKDGQAEVVLSDIMLGCTTDGGEGITSYLTELDDGSVSCVSGAEPSESTTFRVDDINGYFALSAKAQGPTQLTISESLRDGLFNQLVPNNFVAAFADANFLGVIVLATGEFRPPFLTGIGSRSICHFLLPVSSACLNVHLTFDSRCRGTREA